MLYKLFIAITISAVLAGCVTKSDYQRPAAPVKTSNFIDISKPRAEVWKTAVPALARQFFVINNIDQSSGLINLSYAGDPERYVDCGEIKIETPGKPPLVFHAARAQQSYQFMSPQLALLSANRQMNLEGRVNLIFEEPSPTSTRVTATTRYIVTREINTYHQTGQSAGSHRNSITFNTNQHANFSPSTGVPDGIECYPTGRLESDILQLIK